MSIEMANKIYRVLSSRIMGGEPFIEMSEFNRLALEKLTKNEYKTFLKVKKILNIN